MPNPATRIAVVVNPQTLHGTTKIAWEHAAGRLQREANVAVQMTTRGERTDVERLVELIVEHEPDVVVAAGGDGTVSDVVCALAMAPEPPALAILPLGTANNVARSFGLSSFHRGGNASADQAVEAIVAGHERRIDLGEVDGRPFVGAFAVGMDADILYTRNRLRRRLKLGRGIAGYPLYLWSCAVNVLQQQGGTAALTVDGSPRQARFFNILVTNTAIYAGEFRFVAEDSAEDGCLDLHLFTDRFDYLRRYPAAWRRHVRYEQGLRVQVLEKERVRDLVIESEKPVTAQLDGEELQAARRFVVRVLPAALRLKVPVPSGR